MSRTSIRLSPARHLAGVAAGVALAALVVAGPATARPFNVFIPDRYAQQPTISQCEQAGGYACYSAGEIERAYGVLPLYARGIDGRGATIVLLDPYGSPTIAHDLDVYDAANHLPNPPSLRVIAPVGRIPAYNPLGQDVGWAQETTIDVELSHAIAPGANILLVETPVNETEGITGLPELMAAEDYVAAHHLGDVISQSWGATEQTFQNAQGQFAPQQIRALATTYQYLTARGITALAATGDAGATDYELDQSDFYPFPVVDFPDDSPDVTAVGGLNLTLNTLGQRVSPDTVWNDPASVCASPCAGNGGLSVVFGRPAFQDAVSAIVGSSRGLPDVSLSASVSGSVNTYTSFISRAQGVPAAGWYPEAGTSEASPLMAGEVALADQIAGHPLGNINPALYEMSDGAGSGLTDITLGNNTVTFTNPSGGTYTVQGWNAVTGYDLASGLGEPNGSFPAELAALADATS